MTDQADLFDVHLPPSAGIVLKDEAGLFTTSEAIAEGAGVQHKNILQNLDNNMAHFEEFGRVTIQKEPFSTQGGLQLKRIARLNEQQATLMLTFLRNTPQVLAFKKALVKAFYEMAAIIRSGAPRSLEERSLALMAELGAVVDRQRAELEVAAPKVQAYDQFLDADGTYSVGNVAKMLGRSQNKLFADLRNNGIFIAKGAMANTPYQQYMHHFAVKAYTYTRADGTEGTSYTTRVQPSGLDFIQKKLQLKVTA